MDLVTYFFEDCDLDGTADLATHAVGWSVSIRQTVRATTAESTGRIVPGFPLAQIVADPPTGAGTPFKEAMDNGPGGENSEEGLKLIPGSFDYKKISGP